VAPSALPPAPPRLPPDLEPVTVPPCELAGRTRWSGLTLSAAELAGIEARSIHLDEVRLSDCDLGGARLTGLGLLDCELTRCNLANLLGRDCAAVRAAIAESRMTGFAWPEGRLQDVVFRGCRMDLASLRFARLERVTFEECVLREADFQGARMSSVRFHDCDLAGASFHDARFERSELRRCRVDDLQGADGLRGVAMEWTDVVALAAPFAAALGVRVLEEDG
jgi:uncharacterized protein YjbI with pentapeptide repeats